MPAPKLKLEKLSTPATATFPSEIASASTAASPLSAATFPVKKCPEYVKTPISPPSAYTDFLSKVMALDSPVVASSASDSPTSNISPTSAPSLARPQEKAVKTEDASSAPTVTGKRRPSLKADIVPRSPYPAQAPLSAPPVGAASFPSLKLPPSPAFSSPNSPISATVRSESIRSPFSAHPTRPFFNWETALRSRTADAKDTIPSRGSIRHVREVVTRTVTYMPRMMPAPRGKRRKVE